MSNLKFSEIIGFIKSDDKGKPGGVAPLDNDSKVPLDNLDLSNITVDKVSLGLNLVDNTSDLNKPISIVTQAALNTKVDKISGKSLSTNDFTTEYKNQLDNLDLSEISVDKVSLGLDLVDNTRDLDKPISNATQLILNNKVDKIVGKQLSTEDFTTIEKTKLSSLNNSTVESVAGKTGVVSLSKTDVGLTNVDNTSDLNKPISTLTQIALNTKVDKIEGKSLSTNDFTNELKTKLESFNFTVEVDNEFYLNLSTLSLNSEVDITNLVLINPDNIINIDLLPVSNFKSIQYKMTFSGNSGSEYLELNAIKFNNDIVHSISNRLNFGTELIHLIVFSNLTDFIIRLESSLVGKLSIVRTLFKE